MVKGRAQLWFFFSSAWLVVSSGCGSSSSDHGAGAGSSAQAGASGGGSAGRGGASGVGGAAQSGAPAFGGANAGGAGGNLAGGVGASASGGTADSGATGGAAGGDAQAGEGGEPVAGGASSGGANDSGGVGAGAAAGAPAVEVITKTVAIVPDAHGLVTPETNGIGVYGNWSAKNDCETSPGACTQNHVVGPAGGEVPFDTRPIPTPNGEVCLRGRTAQVNADSEYGTKWGARLVLPLNEGPNGELRPYDAQARGIGAFGVEVRLRGPSMVNSSIRIALLLDGVKDSHSREFYGLTQDSAQFVAEFKRVKQGNGASPFSVFDPSRVTAIEITLPTRMGFELDFDLCVTRVLAVPQSLYEPDLSMAPEVPTGAHLVPLEMDADGRLLSNAAGIAGGWYAENDCSTSPGDCTADQTPAPGEPFPIANNRACVSGIVDPVGASSEYATKWGAAIGFYLNRPEPTAAAETYDAVAHRLLGFAYKLRTYSGEPIRVEAISQGVAEPHLYETTQPVVQAMQFAYLLQGSWVTSRTTLDTSKLLAFRFHVPSASGVVRNFDFCVEELAAIVANQ